MWRITLTSPEATIGLGRVLGRLACDGDVICLSGSLGAGKTTLVQGIAAGLGVAEMATSPSFTLAHEYQGRLPLYHLDLYRLGADAVWDLGLAEYLGHGVTVVEWPENLGPLLPPGYLWVSIEAGENDNERSLHFRARGSRHRHLLEALRRECES